MIKKNNSYLINEGYQNNNNLFESGKGSKIVLNGKSFLDLSLGAGTQILGHNSLVFKKTIKSMVKENITLLCTPNKQANSFSRVLKKMFPNKHKFIFCNTGTEAMIKALRICHAITDKNLILSVTGSWHGSVDNLLFTPGKNLKANPLSAGIAKNFQKKIKFIPYNDIKTSEKIIKKYRKKAACIVIEPIQGCLPLEEAKSYLKFLRNISKKYKINLIFDELITGLRTDGRSLQTYFNIKPDISIFGKCFGGGLPIGIIAITKKVYNSIYKKNPKVFFGGTFSGNSLSTYVGKEITTYILKNKKKIFPKLENTSKLFQTKLNEFFVEEKIKAKVYRFKSLLRVVYTDKQPKNRVQRDFFEHKNQGKIPLMKNFLFSKKIYYPNNGVIFFSDKINKGELEYLIKNFKMGFKKFF